MEGFRTPPRSLQKPFGPFIRAVKGITARAMEQKTRTQRNPPARRAIHQPVIATPASFSVPPSPSISASHRCSAVSRSSTSPAPATNGSGTSLGIRPGVPEVHPGSADPLEFHSFIDASFKASVFRSCASFGNVFPRWRPRLSPLKDEFFPEARRQRPEFGACGVSHVRGSSAMTGGIGLGTCPPSPVSH